MSPLTAYIFGLITVIFIFVLWNLLSDLSSDIGESYDSVFCKKIT